MFAIRRIAGLSTEQLYRRSATRFISRISGRNAFMVPPRPLMQEDGPLVWIDCEMTGLDFKKDVLLEIAVIITNGDLKRVDSGISHVIKTDQSVLDGMDDWCTKTHGETGLTAACIISPHSHEWVERTVLDYLEHWIPDKRVGVLAGSSVHTDRTFLAEHMPSLVDWLHYRIVDVSSIKELRHRWFPTLQRKAEDQSSQGIRHRALDDIEASIEELSWYRENIFIKPPSTEKPQDS